VCCVCCVHNMQNRTYSDPPTPGSSDSALQSKGEEERWGA
jgi:hypothetical protein